MNYFLFIILKNLSYYLAVFANKRMAEQVLKIEINAQLMTYFGNFVFGLPSLRLRDFLFSICKGPVDNTP